MRSMDKVTLKLDKPSEKLVEAIDRSEENIKACYSSFKLQVADGRSIASTELIHESSTRVTIVGASLILAHVPCGS